MPLFVEVAICQAGIKHALEPRMLFVTEATNNRILNINYILVECIKNSSK